MEAIMAIEAKETTQITVNQENLEKIILDFLISKKYKFVSMKYLSVNKRFGGTEFEGVSIEVKKDGPQSIYFSGITLGLSKKQLTILVENKLKTEGFDTKKVMFEVTPPIKSGDYSEETDMSVVVKCDVQLSQTLDTSNERSDTYKRSNPAERLKVMQDNDMKDRD